MDEILPEAPSLLRESVENSSEKGSLICALIKGTLTSSSLACSNSYKLGINSYKLGANSYKLGRIPKVKDEFLKVRTSYEAVN